MNISSKPLRLFINNYLKSPKNSKPSAYKGLISLYNNEKKSFIQALKNAVYEILDKLPLYKNTQKALNFIAKSIKKILIEEAKNTKKTYLYEIFEYIINLCYSEKIKVRAGAAYFLILLKNAQLEVKGKVYKKIISLIEDLKLDKSKLVRSYAIELAEKFNMNKVLLGSLAVDPSEKIRKRCLELINIDYLDDHIILSKLYDYSYDVRLNILMKFKNLPFQDISDEAICRVFNLAVFDCEEKVRLKAREMLYGFIDILGFKYFFHKIRDDNGVLNEILKLKLLSNEETAMIFHEKLCGNIENPDLADIYLIRLSSEVIRSINKPLLLDLESFISLGHKYSNDEYYTINILKTLKCFDLYHEDIQNSVLNFIKNICCNFPISNRNNETSYDPNLNPHEDLEKVYENAMHIIKQIFKINNNEYWKFIKLLIDETIEEYLQKHQKLILNQEKSYEEKEFISQKYIEKEDSYENTNQDIEFMQRCEIIYKKLIRSLLIIANGLKYYQSASLDIDFLELLNYLILPSLAYSNNYVRFLGLSSLGYCCLLSFDISEKYLYIFIEEVKTKSFFQHVGLKYLFDIFCTFSYIKLSELDKAIVPMFEGLSSTNEDLLKICIIGFFKLIINDRIPECYGVLLKMIILSSSCLSVELKNIIFYGFKEYVLASEKKARKYVKMVKVFIGIKSEEEKDCLENEQKIRALGKLFDVVDNTQLEGHSEIYHFSLVYYICELFIVSEINRRTADEAISYTKWAHFSGRQLISLLMLFKTCKYKTNSIPTAIQKIINKSIRPDIIPINDQKEKKRSESVRSYIKRYYNALAHPSSIFCLLIDYYENFIYNSITLPIKRPRFDYK